MTVRRARLADHLDGHAGRRRDRKAHDKRLDDLCRAVVFARDRGRCVYCGVPWHSKPLQWAHIHTRAWRSLRWDMDNSMALCARCHMKWHGMIPGHEKLMRTWWEDTYPERAKRLNVRLKVRGARQDLAGVELYLRHHYQHLTGQPWDACSS